MKASLITAYGGPDVFAYGEYADPVAGPGDVLVRVAAAGVNPVDLKEREGALKEWEPLSFPAIIGWDLSGTVQAVGPGVESLRVGDRVCAWAFHTYAELCTAQAELFAKVPDGIELVEAAALPLVTTTGGQLIAVASGVKHGDTVLVSGAAGGVGRSAVFAAKHRGAIVIAGVQKKQLGAPSLGADRVVALDDDEAMKALPPVDIVANAVGGKTAEMLMGKVKPGGSFVSATGEPANAKAFPAVRVVSFVSKQDNAFLLYMLEAVRSGKLVIPIDRKVALSSVADAHVAVAAGGIGKVLLLP